MHVAENTNNKQHDIAWQKQKFAHKRTTAVWQHPMKKQVINSANAISGELTKDHGHPSSSNWWRSIPCRRGSTPTATLEEATLRATFCIFRSFYRCGFFVFDQRYAFVIGRLVLYIPFLCFLLATATNTITAATTARNHKHSKKDPKRSSIAG